MSDHDDHGHSHDDREDHGHGHDHDHGRDHHHHHDAESVAVAVVTVSSSRSADEDPAGDYVAAAFEEAGHEVAVRELIPDDYDSVQGTVDRLARRKDTDAVVTTGGTGVTPDDVTPEAVRGLFAKRLPGFGELFRRLSHEVVGTRTIGSRATAGVVSATPVFCLPGSENAVQLGVDEIILAEVGHLVGLAGRGLNEEGDEKDADGQADGDEDSPSDGA
ncbi:molybdenum cofactor biosynthesis protein B [Halorubrum ezzemoulense]|uniref:Molybdenum cofactor biosynthesis protein n=1 Tax=Halorubrum ezzemoulense TaxID=337243 RepID=A0A238UXZ1_HALEZ|nr:MULTISPECIES: molybdenum cofactor synthesis domain-containing protein [Halorubrum]MDB2236914.1 molybdopterin-binding protein [Halorubrum ezzemoulense]MDB2247097.1 molybdopterin-binding protein [Halorubrum ezzemoulense]MDB2263007.1 molybdopterin-binding protein [Halorubrum ezzemoulense]MDB9252068.1 molybdopterin-binding protein [Halorubrum ezzemoulense]MDB9254702.1 molybdopterin-binding protein [Halorubrum ezzemoulense]